MRIIMTMNLKQRRWLTHPVNTLWAGPIC